MPRPNDRMEKSVHRAMQQRGSSGGAWGEVLRGVVVTASRARPAHRRSREPLAQAPRRPAGPRATTAARSAANCDTPASCPSSPDAANPTSTAWASSATWWSRPSPWSTSSNASPSAGNADSTATTHSSRWAAHSSAGDASRKSPHDRVTSSHQEACRRLPARSYR